MSASKFASSMARSPFACRIDFISETAATLEIYSALGLINLCVEVCRFLLNGEGGLPRQSNQLYKASLRVKSISHNRNCEDLCHILNVTATAVGDAVAFPFGAVFLKKIFLNESNESKFTPLLWCLQNSDDVSANGRKPRGFSPLTIQNSIDCFGVGRMFQIQRVDWSLGRDDASNVRVDLLALFSGKRLRITYLQSNVFGCRKRASKLSLKTKIHCNFT